MGLTASFARALAAVALPPACLGCRCSLGPRDVHLGEPESCLCAECAGLLHPLHQGDACSYCGLSPHSRARSGRHTRCSDCDSLPFGFDAARSAFPYASTAGTIVRHLKYQRSPWMADWLVALALPHLQAHLSAKVPADAVVIPVPMARMRRWRRGYNQAAWIARSLATMTRRTDAGEGLLVRSRFKAPQARFHSREERLDNLKGAFTVPNPRLVAGRSFLLVDDVMTTGATVCEAASALRAAGATRIDVVTIVRAHLGGGGDSDLAR